MPIDVFVPPRISGGTLANPYFADWQPAVAGDDGKVWAWNHAQLKYVPTAMSAGVTDHGALTGLPDDDHTQYHNDARGDARYPSLTNYNAHVALATAHGISAFGATLVDDAADSNARTTLGLGTAAVLNVGVAASNIVQLDGSAKLPAVDGSQLTNLPSGGTPGGSNTQVQVNVAGAFAGYADVAVVDTATYASDTFDRANNASSLGSPETGSAWSALAGTWGINGNQAYTSASSAGAIATIDTGQADGVLTMTFAVAGDIAAAWRVQDVNNYWFYNKGGSLFRAVAGVRTLMASGTTFADGDIITVIILGNTFEVQKNGTVILRYVDALQFGLTATKHGIEANSTTVGRFDNFSFIAYRRLAVDKRIAIGKNLSVGGSVSIAGNVDVRDTLFAPVLKTQNFLPTGYIALTTPQKLYLNTSGSVADTNWAIGYLGATGGAVVTSGVVVTVYNGGSNYGYVINNTAGTVLFELEGLAAKAHFKGQVSLPASTTARASMNMAAGTDPTSPNNGDISFDGTNIKIRVAGAWKTFTLV